MLAGTALSVALGALSAAALPPISAAVASLFGLWMGGVVAGKFGKSARVYHGALVGAGFIVAEALGLIPTLSHAADPLADTVAVIVVDALVLATAALGGWSARWLAGAEPPPGASSRGSAGAEPPPGASSSDTGRGR